MPFLPTSRFRESLLLDGIPDATTSAAGVMSAADKVALAGAAKFGTAIEAGSLQSRTSTDIGPPATVTVILEYTPTGGSPVTVLSMLFDDEGRFVHAAPLGPVAVLVGTVTGGVVVSEGS